eukprot:scaffold187023_cov31-Tisochrysis_lutea.AAC.3
MQPKDDFFKCIHDVHAPLLVDGISKRESAGAALLASRLATVPSNVPLMVRSYAALRIAGV